MALSLLKNRLSAALVFLVAAAFWFPFPAAAMNLDFLDDEYLYDDAPADAGAHDYFIEFGDDSLVSPSQKVFSNDPSYQKLKSMAELGLVDEQDKQILSSGRPLTRNEMARMVNKVLDSYLYWEDTGKVRKYREISVEEEPYPRGEHPQSTPIYEKVYPTPNLPDLPKSQAAGSIPLQKQQVLVKAPSGERVSLTKKGPKPIILPQPQPALEPPRPAKVVKMAEPPQPVVADKRTVRVEEEAEITQKQKDTIEELVNTFKKEIKDLNKDLDGKIKNVEKIALKNQRQIEKLQQEDERFKITGSDDFTFYVTGPYDPAWNTSHTYYGEETRLFNSLALNFSSKPDPQNDFSITGTTKVRTELGSRTGYYGYIDNTNTAFSLYEFNIRYSDMQDDPKNPRNFKLKSLAAGNVSIGYSPLTMFGTKLQGLSLSLKLNDYTLNAFGGRMAYHYPIFLGKIPFHQPGVDTQFDRYVYGFNLASSVFGEQRSMGNLQKIFMYDNFKTNYWGMLFDEPQECRTGFWNQMGYDNDPAAGVGETTDESYKDLFCLPPEKNSVTSAFVRYPVTDRIYVTAEYAHSTYYKPGYKAVIGDKYLHPDDYEKWTEYKDGWYLDEDGKLRDRWGEEYLECDPDDPSQQGSSGCWFNSRERKDQDDGFLLLFDWTKGPIQIFPIGYARLGSEFVTKYFGLPGFDMTALLGGGGDSGGGGGIGFLPIAIQSLELYLTNFSYDKTQDDNYKYSMYYIWGNEIRPMYFDPGLVMYGMSNNKDKGGTMGILAGFVDKINTRRETLRLNAWINTFKYYLSDNINLTVGYTGVNVLLPDSCLDGDRVDVLDDYGNLVDRFTGDGIYDCAGGESDPMLSLKVRMQTQKYELFWKTSKNSESTTAFEISNLDLRLSFVQQGSHVTTVEDLVLDLVPRGRTFKLRQDYKYKLTSTTTVALSYEKKFDTVEDEYTVESYKYPVVDNHKFQLQISTTF